MKQIKYHLIGIGGEGMSPIAEILHRQGHIISGSDTTDKPILKYLSSLGIKVFIGQKEENITDQDVIIYTTAIQGDNPEFKKAKETDKILISRPVMLGKLLDQYKNRITVSGVHGKTTTTTLIDKILSMGGVDNTSLIGSRVAELGGNLRLGHGDTIVTEACEAFKSFLNLKPSIAVLTNIDADHLDNYGTIENIEATFKDFAEKNVDSEGVIIYNIDDERLQRVVKDTGRKLLSYGLSPKADFFAKHIDIEGGFITYDLYINQKLITNIKLRALGTHNVYNSLAAVACASLFDIPLDTIKACFANFNMPARRFNILYNKEVIVVDDYAHHPTEIKSTLTAAKTHFPNHRMMAVFQPHLYSRTQTHYKAFAKALEIADEIVVTDIYAARELPIEGVTSHIICDEIKNKKITFKKMPAICDYLLKEKKEGDIIIFLGAGNIDSVAKKLVSKLEN